VDEPPSTGAPNVVTADEQDEIAVDLDRWSALATAVLRTEGRSGELTLTFVDAAEMAALNLEHMHEAGPTDVLSFPLDDHQEAGSASVPVLLGDVVICPSVAAGAASTHAGTLDDELALLVVHGILHVLGHDHTDVDDTAAMRARELEHLVAHHWGGPPPAGFTHDQGGS
jgi:probable rRNA maturation factor